MNPVDVKAVTEANEEFYAAFEALDMDRMEACWRHDEVVRCIHPGWDVMTGWPQVSRSWVAIFANSGYIQFFLTDVRVHVDADTAWVTCAPRTSSGAGGGPDMEDAKVLATQRVPPRRRPLADGPAPRVAGAAAMTDRILLSGLRVHGRHGCCPTRPSSARCSWSTWSWPSTCRVAGRTGRPRPDGGLR